MASENIDESMDESDLDNYIKSFVEENVKHYNNGDRDRVVAFKTHLANQGYSDWFSAPQYPTKDFCDWAATKNPKQRTYEEFVVNASGFMDQVRMIKSTVSNKAKTFFRTKLSHEDRLHAVDLMDTLFLGDFSYVRVREWAPLQKYAKDLCDEGRDIFSDIKMDVIKKDLLTLKGFTSTNAGEKKEAKELMAKLIPVLREFEKQNRKFVNYKFSEVAGVKKKLKTISEFMCGLEDLMKNIQNNASASMNSRQDVVEGTTSLQALSTPQNSPIQNAKSIPLTNIKEEVKFTPVVTQSATSPSPQLTTRSIGVGVDDVPSVSKPNTKKPPLKSKSSDRKQEVDPTESMKRTRGGGMGPYEYVKMNDAFKSNVASIKNANVGVVNVALKKYTEFKNAITGDVTLTPQERQFLLEDVNYNITKIKTASTL